MTADRAAITGLILAGGRGSRMGHVDKGLQPFRGATMVEHVMRRLAPQVDAIAINANQNSERYGAFGAPVWCDDLTGFEGPLAGLETGMRRAATPYVVTAPCDSPFLPADLVTRLYAALTLAGADLALAQTEEIDDSGVLRLQPQPVFALVKTAALPHLSAFLATGKRRMDGWYDAIKVVRVQFDDAAAFRNINTLQELQQFEDEP